MSRLSVTRTIFSVLGYRTSDVYFSICAKSTAFHVSATTVSRLPASSSEIMNTSAAPFRTYTEPAFSGFPGSQGMRSSFISCLFRQCRLLGAEDHMDADILQGRLPWRPQIPRLPLGYTILLQAMVSVHFFITSQTVLSAM